MFLILTTVSQTLKTIREINNHIAYNLKTVEIMNQIRSDDFEANLRFQVVSVEVFEICRKIFESETDFRILRFVSQKDSIRLQNRPKTAKTDQDFKIRSHMVAAKGFFETGLEVLVGFEGFIVF